MRVLKFGGSSLGTPERIKGVKKIVEQKSADVIIVVSAFEGVTDQLISMAKKAVMHDETYQTELTQLETLHISFAKELIPANNIDQTMIQINTLLSELKNVLHGIFLIRDLSDKTLDFLLSFGERLSSAIVSQVIDNATLADAREFIRTDNSFGRAAVDFNLTNPMIKDYFSKKSGRIVVPGFIASTTTKETTTLGRGGSDYTAAIIAAAMEASLLEIWTDVDGFMTADPRKVEKAFAVKNLTFAEAMELSHFGAKVVYTPTIKPVFQKNIPVVIKNTFNPSAVGTIISREDETSEDGLNLIKGISSIDNISLITLQGAGLVGVTGISMRLFSCLGKHRVNIVLITQASSEFSITFAVSPTDARKAIKAIKSEFEAEIEYRHEIKILLEENLSIIAIVGEKMKNTPGISATLFSALGRAGINIIATAQGSSELNISVVIKAISLTKALNVIHEAFFLSTYRELNLYVMGIGTVGSSLLKQLHKQQAKLMTDHRLKLNLIGVSNSRKMLVDAHGIDFASYRILLDTNGVPRDHNDFVRKIKALNLRNSVFVDCTANEHVAGLYEELLNSYVSVVTANKIACSSEFALYQTLKQSAQKHRIKFFYETNVGAGLPVIGTINDLIRSGDRVLKIEAVLSGTLNFIFNVLDEDVPMSKAIQLAKEKGYSEPDPRIDLSGKDVVRKLLILSRESGYALENDDIIVKPFLPLECFDGSIEDFWSKVSKYDAEFEERRKNLVKQNKRWRFVARLVDGKGSIELMEVDMHHPAYNLEGSNNIILLTTERYKDYPMIIKGYGAGAEVTAAGVFADIIRVANV
jgi:bifunctional aspartokinase / homoserine dehydrogenase 1